jgi:hypothetical protein
MADMPPNKVMEKGEKPLLTKFFKQWAGCYTKGARTAMPQDRWYQLINLQPVGPANVITVPNIGALAHDFAADIIYWADYANILGNDYIYAFSTNGKIFQYNIATKVTSQINGGNLLSGANSRMDQWENLAVLFIDANGYYSWDGTTFTKITNILSPGAPQSGEDIAVFAGRVWISQKRAIFYSVVANQNAINTGYGNNPGDWTAANGSSFTLLVDPVIRNNITRLKAINGYLYVMTRSSINVIADVYVPTTTSAVTTTSGLPISPPTPVFTNLNIDPIIGTDQPSSVFGLSRSLVFCNRYGMWKLDGTTATKISDDIDSTVLNIDFSQAVSGGQCIVNNILTAGFLLKLKKDPTNGSALNPFPNVKNTLAMWWDNKWWFANFGNLSLVCHCYANNMPFLFGFIGNKMYPLFSDTTTDPATLFMGPLWDMDDPLRSKKVIRAGMEMSISRFAGTITLNVDTENSSTPINQSGKFSTVTWVDANGNPITWLNSTPAIVRWFSAGYDLFHGVAPGSFSKYVGLSGNTSGANIQLSCLMTDYEMGARWAQ